MLTMTNQTKASGRRCALCGAKAGAEDCGECGSPIAQRSEIGFLAGVNQNFGTVNNVYNIRQGETEIVDLRDIQDGLNHRFPERVPLPSPPEPKRLTSGATKKVNAVVYVLAAVFALAAIAFTSAILWM